MADDYPPSRQIRLTGYVTPEMEKIPKNPASELLTELQRLNRTGIINDEEFLVLRKIIWGGSVSLEQQRRFESLFGGEPKSVPLEPAKDKRSFEPPEKPSGRKERIYSMDEAINELNLRFTASGRKPAEPRKLLSCPACGLFETVTNKGKFITAESGYGDDDTGLSFTKVNAEEWECPDCGHLFPEP